MKWTRFKQEFDPGGPLHRLLKNGDVLIKDPGSPVNPPEPDIWVSQNHDPIIDSCFRIYSNPAALQKKMWNGVNLNQRELNYHPWHYYQNVPQEYSDPVYFAPIVTQQVALANISQAQVVPGKVARAKKAGGVYSSIYSKSIPHPYEIFIGGWVYFYDSEVRHGETDHAIYFEWDRLKKNVTIYLYQTKPIFDWNVYVRVNPPTSQDPTLPKSPPPYC